MKKIAVLLGILMLVGCLATTVGIGPQGPEAGRSAEVPTVELSPSAAPVPPPAKSVSRLFDTFNRSNNAEEAFELQRAQLDLVLPDGAACRVVSDALRRWADLQRGSLPERPKRCPTPTQATLQADAMAAT